VRRSQGREIRTGLQLDVIPQISLFGKLKLENCAPIPGWPETGFFNARARRVRSGCDAGDRAFLAELKEVRIIGRVAGRPEK
jgi:hypothetical protein